MKKTFSNFRQFNFKNINLNSNPISSCLRVRQDPDRVSNVSAIVEKNEAQLRFGREVVNDEFLGGRS